VGSGAAYFAGLIGTFHRYLKALKTERKAGGQGTQGVDWCQYSSRLPAPVFQECGV
jgi:hypothetical protein